MLQLSTPSAVWTHCVEGRSHLRLEAPEVAAGASETGLNFVRDVQTAGICHHLQPCIIYKPLAVVSIANGRQSSATCVPA